MCCLLWLLLFPPSLPSLSLHRYGDVVPVTNIGQVMSIFLMIAGSFYMSMPLTAAASTFYQVHERYQIKHNKPEVGAYFVLYV